MTEQVSGSKSRGAVDAEIASLVTESEGWTARRVIEWTLGRYGRKAAFVTSFQAEGMVILDIALSLDRTARVLTIDTGRLPPETYELIDRVRERYGVEVEVVHPDHSELTSFVTLHGVNAFYRSVEMRRMCCYFRKVSPLNRALAGSQAWVTGLTRGQSEGRASTPKIEIDLAHDDIIKVNPLADWSNDQVWGYIREHGIPYNALYDAGYPSIGCAPCTRPVRAGEDSRAGRWWWETDQPKECGLHVKS
ncbi:MAG: phosphoadenylyl-sulfate reductase [SAR202 cluster bacterium]|nr:phosphoadenylyl-sulfate reductase [SAR202 cluster bacterium]